jgi:hypothetical protein
MKRGLDFAEKAASSFRWIERGSLPASVMPFAPKSDFGDGTGVLELRGRILDLRAPREPNANR